MPFSSVPEALADLRDGRLLLVAEGEQGETQLCVAAEKVTPDAINFMATHGRGLVCLTLTEERMRALGIPMMVPDAAAVSGRSFGASIEARRGVTTGISAGDRATTIQTAVADEAGPDDIVMPGHIFPVLARPGGVLARPGLAEASVDLVRMAGLKPAAAVCSVLKDDGNVAEPADIESLADQFRLRIVRIADIVTHRLRTESVVHRVGERTLTVKTGSRFRVVVYRNDVDRYEHVALTKGNLRSAGGVLVRIHSQCLTGDVLGSQRCDCGEQLERALRMIEREGRGVLIYLHQEGRGIGLANKLRAYALQDRGLDTVQANLELGFKEDNRDYGIGAQILRDLGVARARLITNNPKKIEGLLAYGIRVVERVPIEIPPHPGTLRYLQAKQQKLGHLFTRLDTRG